MPGPDMTVDLLVVGGGVLGAFHAHAAPQRRLSVALLERSAKPRGATVRNFGQIVPSGMDRRWQRIGRESLRVYEALQARVDLSLRRLGSLYLASDEDELSLIEELRVINEADDYPSQLWTAAECRKRYPQLSEDYVRGGLFFPEEFSANPRVMIGRLHQFLAEQPRCEIRFDACVVALETGPDGLVTAVTADGRRVAAAQAVVCSGTEFQLLYPERFRSSDLAVVKLQMLRLTPQPESSLPGNVLTGSTIRRYESFAQCPSWDTVKSRESPSSFAAREGIHILFKQETDGGIILGDSHAYASVQQSEDLDYEIRADINDYFLDEARKIFHLPRWDVESSWLGIYCQTTNSAGVLVDEVDDKIRIVTGIGGKGMTGSAGFAKQHLATIYND